jgi:dCMP deaminase
MNWDEYFMSLVYLVAMRSKDQSTKIGAVVVGPDHEIRSTGYNSFVRGIDDYVEERQQRPEKYFWMCHAEVNSVYNAARIGASLKDCIIYTNGIPCMHCALSIVQSGIKEVIVHKLWNDQNKDIWIEHAERSTILFNEAGVKLRIYDGKIQTEIYGFNRGSKIEL